MPEGAQLEALTDDRVHLPHHERAMALTLVSGRRRDGLDVARPERVPRHLQLALHHGRVGDDLTVELDHDVDAAESVRPVRRR